MKRLILLVAVIVGVLAVPAGALSYDFSDGAYGPPGSQMVLGSDAVPVDQQGLTCDVTVDLANNDSIRPGSDITVTSGSSSRTFLNTEGVKGDPGPVTFPLVLGSTVTATLTFGPNTEYDGHDTTNAAFSGSGTVNVGACVTPVTVSPEVVTIARPVTAATPLAVQPAFTG